MAVYCDECLKPGSPNDEAGYTRGGGWLCEEHRKSTRRVQRSGKQTDEAAS